MCSWPLCKSEAGTNFSLMQSGDCMDISEKSKSRRSLFMKRRSQIFERRLHCHSDQVCQRNLCDNGKEICQNICNLTFRVSVFLIKLIAFVFFSFSSPLSWLFELASSVTKQNNCLYAMISLKKRRFDEKRILLGIQTPQTSQTGAFSCQIYYTTTTLY